jgi:hypothetical protein
MKRFVLCLVLLMCLVLAVKGEVVKKYDEFDKTFTINSVPIIGEDFNIRISRLKYVGGDFIHFWISKDVDLPISIQRASIKVLLNNGKIIDYVSDIKTEQSGKRNWFYSSIMLSKKDVKLLKSTKTKSVKIKGIKIHHTEVYFSESEQIQIMDTIKELSDYKDFTIPNK